MRIDFIDLFLIMYFSIGVGHAFTMYFMDELIDKDPGWDDIDIVDFPFYALLWPIFVYSMLFDTDE